MKLTESKLRQIIREEMQEFGGEMYHNQFRNYLSSVGKSTRSGFEYKGYFFILDPMSYALNVNMIRDRHSDRQPVATARIEDDGVRFKKRIGGGRPNIENAVYRSPNQVIDRLMKMA